ncbi:hypothetical protein [Paenibacillus sp. Z6-24]
MNNYIISFIRKFDYFFKQQEILNVIYLYDEEDNEKLDHVLFFETIYDKVIGIYIRGMNPLFSKNRIYDLDDFNLFASYEKIIETKENMVLKVEQMKLFFSTQYNELLGFYLSDNDATNSIFIAFLQDEIYLERNCSEYGARQRIKEKVTHEAIITYEKKYKDDWKQIDL